MIQKKVPVFLAALGVATLAFAACTKESSTPAPAAASAPAAQAPAAPSAAAPVAFSPGAKSTLANADPEFNYAAMVWQAYWLSRDHFGPVVMQSGLGMTFQPPMDMLQKAMGMMAQNPKDPIMIPENMAPLMAVYASADTALTKDITKLSPLDFSSMRLNADTFDKTIMVRAMGQTMLKESQWVRSFNNAHFGKPTDDFGAQQRFIGVMLGMMVQMQGQALLEKHRGQDGLFRDSDGKLDHQANWELLHAFADIAGITTDKNLTTYDAGASPMWQGAATALAKALSGRQPANAREFTAAIRALTYYAWTTTDAAERAAALDRAARLGAALAALSPASPAERAAAIAGLSQVNTFAPSAQLSDRATALFNSLAADFDRANGVFKGMSAYTTDDVAWLMGGLNAAAQLLPGTAGDEAKRVLLAFYEALLDQSGMQLSAPPGKDGAMAGAFEKNLPSVVNYHGRNTPPPPMAGGQFGRAPLPAAKVSWNGSQWKVEDTRVVVAEAMHLANELNWLGPHLGAVPFPKVSK